VNEFLLPTLFCLVPVLVLAAAAGVVGLTARARRRREYQTAVRAWSDIMRNGSVNLDTLAQAEHGSAPRWYLAGCALLRAGCVKQAARAFGMAHHADHRLETAALLAFACLKAHEGPDGDLPEQIAQTWEQMKRFDVRGNWEDRAMLACLRADAREAQPLSPLGRLAWSVVDDSQRTRLLSGAAVAALAPLWSTGR